MFRSLAFGNSPYITCAYISLETLNDRNKISNVRMYKFTKTKFPCDLARNTKIL
jgi:hypothetical protein